MKLRTLSLAAMSSFALPALAQQSPSPSPTAAPPAAVSPAGAGVPGGAQAAAPANALMLRKLPAVLDARERQQDWKTAAEEAEKLVSNEDLRNQLKDRLNGLVPMVAKELAQHTQEDALVSIAVYKKSDSDPTQAMVAVTFQGLGTNIPQETLGAMVADVPPTAPEADDIPKGLVFDPAASSYLVFFLGTHDLQAGDIPNAKMKQTVIAAANNQQVKQREEARAEQGREARAAAGAGSPASAQAAAARVNAEVLDPPASNDSTVEQHPQIPVYPYGNPANDGYYYPGVGTPVVILNGFRNTPSWRDREIAREHALEQRALTSRTATAPPAKAAAPATPAPAPAPKAATPAPEAPRQAAPSTPAPAGRR